VSTVQYDVVEKLPQLVRWIFLDAGLKRVTTGGEETGI
jgi:hypothetical protein